MVRFFSEFWWVTKNHIITGFITHGIFHHYKCKILGFVTVFDVASGVYLLNLSALCYLFLLVLIYCNI